MLDIDIYSSQWYGFTQLKIMHIQLHREVQNNAGPNIAVMLIVIIMSVNKVCVNGVGESC